MKERKKGFFKVLAGGGQAAYRSDMAAAANQALRFLVAGGGGGGAGSFDACNRILADLCTTGNPKVILCGVCSCRLKALTAVGDWFIRGDACTTCSLEGFLIF